MAGRNSIKLFQFNQKYSQSVGICLPKSSQRRFSINPINLLFIISLSLFLAASFAFILHDAKSMRDYGVEFFTIISIIEAMFMYSIPVWQLKNMLKFIEHCEGFIETSKINQINQSIDITIASYFDLSLTVWFIVLIRGEHKVMAYKKLNMKIEQLSQLYFYAILATIICIGLLPLLYTYVSYFILDFGDDSFYLYPPTEFVLIFFQKPFLPAKCPFYFTFLNKVAIRLENATRIFGGMAW